jgi:hypothetical protein
MSKHTPGPWVSAYRNAAAFDVSAPATGDARRGRIAEVVSAGGKDVPTMRANARLIAAAPDLLAALEFVLPLVVDEWGHYQVSGSNGMRAITMIRDAIAKAKGEA